MRKKLLKLLLILVGAALVAILGFLVLQPNPIPPLPQPNGYSDLIKAGMVSESSADYATMNETELRELVSTNADALKLARIGLSRECRVILDYGPAAATNSAHLDNLSHTKRLAQAFAAEGRLAEVENRPGDAAAVYLDDIRLGQAVTRGGAIIDALVGIALEAIGSVRLEKLVPTLDAKQCREVVAALEVIESKRETPAAVLEQEKDWARRTYGLKGEVTRLVTFRTIRQVEQSYVSRATRQQARTNRSLIDLAVRAFELEKGQRPATLAELVPAYLKAIPQDLQTGTNMVYQPTP
jgi:hypothetical protein